MKLLLMLAAFLLYFNNSVAQTNIFRAIVVANDTMQLGAGTIIFPLSKDTIYVDTSGIIKIDLTKESNRLFYYAWGNWVSRIYRFPDSTTTDMLVTIKVPDNKYYTSFVEQKKCPICLSGKHIIPVLYGYPSKKLFRKADAGKVLLGGCIISDSAPLFYCKKDSFQF